MSKITKYALIETLVIVGYFILGCVAFYYLSRTDFSTIVANTALIVSLIAVPYLIYTVFDWRVSLKTRKSR